MQRLIPDEYSLNRHAPHLPALHLPIIHHDTRRTIRLKPDRQPPCGYDSVEACVSV